MAKTQTTHQDFDHDSPLSRIRHSASHLLAHALMELYPGIHFAIGPATAEGFYYDVELPKGAALSDADFTRIETRMKELAAQGLNFEKTTRPIKDAIKWAESAKQPYKVELLKDLEKSGETEVSFYTVGQFEDLCKGPHVASTAEIGGLKLLSLAGAYWRGDEKKPQLTRIYGTAFGSEAELSGYLEMLEEAKRRDHRKLGAELDLFTFSELVGAGLPLFTPKGTLIRELIVDKIQTLQKEYGYERVTIPHITKKELYEVSGHWDKFKDDLFHVKGASETEFVMKPMNCPHHTQIYASRPRSYKELPVRFMETTMVYRDEQAGELLGLARVRSITQDDGHVFCTIDQVQEEARNIVRVIKSFYTDLGLLKEGNYWVSLSVRDGQDATKYLGEPSLWDQAEQMLEEVAKLEELDYRRVEGEAAFYGPKLDFMFKDSLGRERQLGTVQADFVMPERFGLKYTDKDGSDKVPVMLHRAVAGSLERFMAIILEHFAGALPFWLSPVQVKILPISDKHQDYGLAVAKQLENAGIRAELDFSNESIGKKIRGAQTLKIPYMLVVGDKEVEASEVAVRSRSEEELGTMSVEALINHLSDQQQLT
jgi:threonyl-tRNA synthetase